MRHINKIALKTTLLAVSGLGLIAVPGPAMAGGCGFGSTAATCNMGVSVNPGQAPSFGPMTVNVAQPMGHLRSINYQRAPHTSITRVHGLMQPTALSDAPSSFTGGCHPTSTAYCRQDAGTPVNVQFNAPAAPAFAPAPTFAAAPTYTPAPTFNLAPLPAPRTVAIGGGYDPSKFIPRTYGDNTLTPGTAYVPTSFVNRNPADAARVLAENGLSSVNYGSNSYSTSNSGAMNLSAPVLSSPSFAAPAVSTPSFSAPSYGTSSAINLSGGLAGGLAGGLTGGLAGGAIGAPQGGNYLGSVVTGTTTTGGAASANAVSGVDGSGGYWEKVSGLTMFGDTVATSVVCRRQAPQQTQQVVSPVYGVPTPVPTAVPYYVDVPYKVRGKIPAGCRPVGPRPLAVPVPHRIPAPFPAAMPGVLPYGPTRGGQFGGGFGLPLAPTIGQFGEQAMPPLNTGWTY